jgi:hypothetical protein
MHIQSAVSTLVASVTGGGGVVVGVAAGVVAGGVIVDVVEVVDVVDATALGKAKADSAVWDSAVLLSVCVE